MLERDYDGTRAYGQSKLAQITSGFELAARLPADEVTVNSLHPATYMPTKIVLAEIGHSIDTLDQGVTATHRLVTDPALAGITGRFYDRTRDTRAHSQAYDSEARQRLWQASLGLTKAENPLCRVPLKSRSRPWEWPPSCPTPAGPRAADYGPS